MFKRGQGDQLVRSPLIWRVLSWGLLAGFAAAAALNMMDIAGGFATNHLADVAGPAWLYIVLRGLAEPEKRTRLGRFFGATPERAAAILLIGSSVTELSQIYWPRGVFSGRFDPLDLAAFAVGIVLLYLLDRRHAGSTAANPPRAT